MNAERLLAHYEQVADAPNAIGQLRRFILDLAVRGKLVPQVQKDEPAADLLKRIASEKLDQGNLPKAWRRARVGAFLDFQYGKGLNAKERFESGPVPVFGSNGIVGYTEKALTDRPSIIVGRKGSAGALNLCDGSSWTTDVAYFVEAPSFIEIRFLLIAFSSMDLDKLGKGVKPGLSRSDAYEQIMCIPPLAEQHRIVAKVDELMALCDRLEAARAEREITRDRLAASSLARLNAPDPETFQADARFTLKALPALTTRPDQIKQLRQAILNLAVRGKLVPQAPKDEPAAELLKRIAKEKARRVQEREIRQRDIQPPIASDEVPFQLPQSWVWSRLGTVCFQITDGAHHTPKYIDEGVPFLSVKDVSGGTIDFSRTRFISEEAHRELAKRCNPELGDILLTKVGTTGIAVDINVEREFSIFVSLALLKFSQENIDRRYLCNLINSPFVKRQSADNTQGIGNKNLVLRLINQFLIPLPPLAEQNRIVAKVDELMALCDQLEASLTDTATNRRRLLDALLAEALAPVELEAA